MSDREADGLGVWMYGFGLIMGALGCWFGAGVGFMVLMGVMCVVLGAVIGWRS